MISPWQSPMAFSKFFVDPRLLSFISRRIVKGGRGRNALMVSTLSSVELSSQMTSSSGSLLCAAILSSCSDKKRPPLYVHIATEIRSLFIRSLFSMAGTPLASAYSANQAARIVHLPASTQNTSLHEILRQFSFFRREYSKPRNQYKAENR